MNRDLPASSRLPFWSRVVFAAAATSLGLGFAFGLGPLFMARGETAFYAMLKWTEPVVMTLMYVAAFANAAAFLLALTCFVRRVRGVPWLVLLTSSLGIFYCVAYLSRLLPR